MTTTSESPRLFRRRSTEYYYLPHSERIKQRLARGAAAVAIGGTVVVGVDLVAQAITSERYSSASTALMLAADNCQPRLSGANGTVITQLPTECKSLAPYLQQSREESEASDIALGLPAGTTTYRIDDRLGDTVAVAMGYAQGQQEQDAAAMGHAWGASALLIIAAAGGVVSIQRRIS